MGDVTLRELIDELDDDHPARVEWCEMVAENVMLRKQRDHRNNVLDEQDKIIESLASKLKEAQRRASEAEAIMYKIIDTMEEWRGEV